MAFGLTRSVKAFLKFEAGLTRSRGSGPSVATGSAEPQSAEPEDQRIERLRRRVKKAELENAELRARLAAGGVVDPNKIIWVFGAGRTGSTWLAAMMGELEKHEVWFEPWVGELFNPNHMKVENRRGKSFILAPRYKKDWLGSIRTFVLDGASARFPEFAANSYLVIKEPGGSAGAPLLMEALPESRMVMLVRDPRDVAASWADAHRKGSWMAERKGEKELNALIQNAARRYLQHMGGARRAYDVHTGRKVLVKYEELRADTLGTMKRLYSELGVEVAEQELARAVEKHSWENIPKEQKGEGKFYRKANPGGWREDLTSRQVEVVEEITAPILEEFYPD